MIFRPCVLQRFTSDPRRSGKQKPTCRPLIKTRQRTALEEMNNTSRLKRKKGLKRKITQNEIRRTAVPHALQRTHFALRAEKRAKRKRKRKRKRNQKNRGPTRFTTHTFCVESRKKGKTQTQTQTQSVPLHC